MIGVGLGANSQSCEGCKKAKTVSAMAWPVKAKVQKVESVLDHLHWGGMQLVARSTCYLPTNCGSSTHY